MRFDLLSWRFMQMKKEKIIEVEKITFVETVIAAFKKQMFSDYEGDAERMINEVVYLYEEKFGEIKDNV